MISPNALNKSEQYTKYGNRTEDLHVAANFMDEILSKMKTHIHGIQKKKDKIKEETIASKFQPKTLKNLTIDCNSSNTLNQDKNFENFLKCDIIPKERPIKLIDAAKKLQTIHENKTLDMDNQSVDNLTSFIKQNESDIRKNMDMIRLYNQYKLPENARSNIKSLQVFVSSKENQVQPNKTQEHQQQQKVPKPMKKQQPNNSQRKFQSTNKGGHRATSLPQTPVLKTRDRSGNHSKVPAKTTTNPKSFVNKSRNTSMQSKNPKSNTNQTSKKTTPKINNSIKQNESNQLQRSSFEHSYQIRNIVNQITSNLKQNNNNYRLQNFNLKREMYINGYSPSVLAANKTMEKIETNIGKINSIIKPVKNVSTKNSLHSKTVKIPSAVLTVKIKDEPKREVFDPQKLIPTNLKLNDKPNEKLNEKPNEKLNEKPNEKSKSKLTDIIKSKVESNTSNNNSNINNVTNKKNETVTTENQTKTNITVNNVTQNSTETGIIKPNEEIVKQINEKIQNIIDKALDSGSSETIISNTTEIRRVGKANSQTIDISKVVITIQNSVETIQLKENKNTTQLPVQKQPLVINNKEPPKFMRSSTATINKTDSNQNPIIIKQNITSENNMKLNTIQAKNITHFNLIKPQTQTGGQRSGTVILKISQTKNASQQHQPTSAPTTKPQSANPIQSATINLSTINALKSSIQNFPPPTSAPQKPATPVLQTRHTTPKFQLARTAQKPPQLPQLATNNLQKPPPPPPEKVTIVNTFNKTTSSIAPSVQTMPMSIVPMPRKPSINTLNIMNALGSSKKMGLLTPMEIVQDFVNLVNNAKRNRRTYTICGNFFSIRRAFAERGWVEKMRINIMDDRETWKKIENLSNFELVDGMRDKEHGEKYRRVFLTKLLAGHQVDFYWDYLTNPFSVNNDKIKRTLINRFPYGTTRPYTSKHGLCESLKEIHWYCIEGYANIYFPRTYNLGMNDEMASFIEDFRITAITSLLQWIVNNVDTPERIIAIDGEIPTSVYNFATIQCYNFIKVKEHKDIDEVIPQAKDYEWDVFLEKFYKIIHNEQIFKTNDRISSELMIEQARYVLKKIRKYLPHMSMDGCKNMWLLKPINGSRGSGIHVCRTLKYMIDTVASRKDVKYVVQKYIERPLLIHQTKFDIRQWFLVTCMPNLKIWMYKECYLRFSTQIFDLSKLHESIHLTNNSIQSRYKNNVQRSNNLPIQNMWDSETFRRYLVENGQPYTWRNLIYKGMKECLVALFMLCQDKMDMRINSFELCGADFMLDEEYHPYLIEINSRPALYPSTKITARMCPKVLEDVIKVTIDNARNPKASTGDFELIYADTFNYSIPRNVNSLYVEGISYFTKYVDQKYSIAPIISTNLPDIKLEEPKNESIKKILNIDPSKVKKDVRNTLEKILAVIHSDQKNDNKETISERNKQFRSMLSEFVSIISNVRSKTDEI